jgi:hypothetical protein
LSKPIRGYRVVNDYYPVDGLSYKFVLYLFPFVNIKILFMIEVIEGLPGHVTAFRATGTVTKDDYQKVINPIVKNAVVAFGRVSYMLVLNTELKNYTLGAWIEDGLLGLRHYSKWEKLAIVTEKDSIKKFTDNFGFLIPCPTKGFKMEELGAAKKWVSDL